MTHEYRMFVGRVNFDDPDAIDTFNDQLAALGSDGFEPYGNPAICSTETGQVVVQNFYRESKKKDDDDDDDMG